MFQSRNDMLQEGVDFDEDDENFEDGDGLICTMTFWNSSSLKKTLSDEGPTTNEPAAAHEKGVELLYDETTHDEEKVSDTPLGLPIEKIIQENPGMEDFFCFGSFLDKKPTVTEMRFGLKKAVPIEAILQEHPEMENYFWSSGSFLDEQAATESFAGFRRGKDQSGLWKSFCFDTIRNEKDKKSEKLGIKSENPHLRHSTDMEVTTSARKSTSPPIMVRESPRPSTAEPVKRAYHIERRFIRTVIGFRGETIRALRREYKVEIEFDKKNNKVIISGVDEGCCTAAWTAIWRIMIKQKKNEIARRNERKF